MKVPIKGPGPFKRDQVPLVFISVSLSLCLSASVSFAAPLERPRLDGRLSPADEVEVEIISPEKNQVLEDGPITVQFEVTNFDMKAGGPHLHFVLDNEYYFEHYDPKTPIRINSLAPGTHVLVAFAVSSWHESWKNKEAHAIIKFHVQYESLENDADLKGPFFILNLPMGDAQKWADRWLLFDFLVFNTTIAEADTRIQDYRVHYSLDGDDASVEYYESRFWLDMKPGTHVIQAELTDRRGQRVMNGKWNFAARQFTV